MRLCVSVLVAFATACSYNPSFQDCNVSCSATAECPATFTCGPEGLCRAFGESTSCAAIRDARDMEQDGSAAGDASMTDGAVVDAPAVDAMIDAPPGPSNYYGCFAVPDDSTTCTQICTDQQMTCSTACTGQVWYAYSLAGPCANSQPTNYSGNSCTQRAAIGTGDTIYVQCCCR